MTWRPQLEDAIVCAHIRHSAQYSAIWGILQARVGQAGMALSLHTLLSAQKLWSPTCAMLTVVRGEQSTLSSLLLAQAALNDV